MVEWFKQQFSQNEVLEAEQLNVKPEVVMEEMIRHVPPGSDGLLLQPYWSPGIKIPGSEARGSVLGFTDIHTRGHFYRAVLEGLAFAMREGKERIEKRSKQNITSLRVSGGGSQSDTAMQITADIFGLPAVRPHTFETSGLGAAMITAVSRGIHPDFETAIAEMSHTGKVFEPKIQNRKLYDQIYQKCYTKMYKRVRPLYQALSLIYGAGK